MKNDLCKCTEIDSISMETFEWTRKSAEQKCTDVFQVDNIDSIIRKIFSYNGRVGVALGCGSEDEPWDRAVLSLPTSFGFLVSTIRIENRDIRKDEGSIDLELATTLNLLQSQQARFVDFPMWKGALTLSGNVYNPSSFKTIPAPSDNFNQLGIPPFIKQYDWKCLTKCAPSCLTCEFSIECWMLCAGGCVIACALPF